MFADDGAQIRNQPRVRPVLELLFELSFNGRLLIRRNAVNKRATIWASGAQVIENIQGNRGGGFTSSPDTITGKDFGLKGIHRRNRIKASHRQRHPSKGGNHQDERQAVEDGGQIPGAGLDAADLTGVEGEHGS